MTGYDVPRLTVKNTPPHGRTPPGEVSDQDVGGIRLTLAYLHPQAQVPERRKAGTGKKLPHTCFPHHNNKADTCRHTGQSTSNPPGGISATF